MNEALLPFSWVQKHGIFYSQQEACCVYCRPDVTEKALHEVFRVLPVSALVELSEEVFNSTIAQAYQQAESYSSKVMAELENEEDFFRLAEELPGDEDLLDREDGAPVIRFINAMLNEAIKEGASDIHLEPFEKQLTIRFRIDGILRAVLTPPRQLSAVLISRIKVMSRLDIAEKRLPQDGRITVRVGGRAIDVRVSTLPARHGERVVLRLLDKSTVKLALSALGLSPKTLAGVHQLLATPHGIILVTGPTGSGKSTTLYSALNQINTLDRNIMTIEDPVEYDLEGIGQTQVNTKVGMTFAQGLRAILRQDPDVIMVGEIRDTDTAQIAVQASLTGHLVLSTLHTNSAVGAIGRLRDMGVEPFLLASSLFGVLSQRLIRKLCEQCRTPAMLSPDVLGIAEITQPVSVFHARGCEACNHTGYRGRTAIHELVIVDDDLRHAITEAQHDKVLEKLIRRHTPSIRTDGFQKVLAGLTSPEEVLRVISQG